MSMFERKKTLDELEEANERADAELQLAEKKALLKECKSRYGSSGWKMFSKNGMTSGIDWQALKFKVTS